jgi:hypothetical protein
MLSIVKHTHITSHHITNDNDDNDDSDDNDDNDGHDDDDSEDEDDDDDVIQPSSTRPNQMHTVIQHSF